MALQLYACPFECLALNLANAHFKGNCYLLNLDGKFFSIIGMREIKTLSRRLDLEVAKMSNDLANNKEHGQHDSVTDHASKVFEESSVCAVSAVLSTDNKPRKIFRSLVFLLFTVAFLYQCIAFLCYALQYPTVVDTEILRDKTFVSPAYTFCNFNPIKRSKFCEEYPNNCTKPDEEFYDEHPRFCGTPDTLILKEDDFDTENLYEFFHLNHDAEDMVDFGSDDEDKPVGPLPRLNPHEMESLIGACFTINDRVNSPLDPYMLRRNPLGNGMGVWQRFDPEESEVIYPIEKAGIMFQLHSPFEPVNPFETGYFMRPGYLYRITVKMTQEEKSYDCLNYTEVWMKNNKTGYRSRAACKYKCAGDIVVKCVNCTEPFILYPYPNKNFCGNYGDVSRLSGICEHPEDIVKECFKECKEECV
ncbi:hypothetical protein AVEN_242143-1 [Araneus ventricosus]|uniref:Uncharacterized protein n=1 Tax=Araneus ventricosus TaxID=182803 RepID=A0A4Y2M385_ARAVE|nr:hypothetical protein AVEN_242143-1 [Araneus ventricosus]